MNPITLRSRAVTIAPCLFILIVIAIGCDSSDPRGERVSVEGTVTLDGKPISAARILFMSEGGDAGTLKASGAIKDGVFSITKETGPVVGMNRVEIHPQAVELEELEAARKKNPRKRVSTDVVSIPKKYGTSSELTADVKADATTNKFTFELKTR